MKKSNGLFPNVKGMTLAAMLVAMSVVIGIFCKNYLSFGGGLFRVTCDACEEVTEWQRRSNPI